MSGATAQQAGPLIVGPSNGVNNPANLTTFPASPAGPAPSQFLCGVAMTDPRFPYRGGSGIENSALMQVGIGLFNRMGVVDQAPSTAVVNNIAAAANATSGTAFTLVSSSGAGITVTTAATFIPQTGRTVASGALAIDLAPGLVYFGTGLATAVQDPTKNVSRAVSITAASGGIGGVALVAGADLYGVPMTEKITVASSPSGSTTTNGAKAFKFISSVTPQFTDAHNYSVGIADKIGFPIKSDSFAYANITWAGTPVASSAGYVAAVSTTASNTTGDVRGTYTVQTVADGVKTLQIFQAISPANIASVSGYFGVTQA